MSEADRRRIASSMDMTPISMEYESELKQVSILYLLIFLEYVLMFINPPNVIFIQAPYSESVIRSHSSTGTHSAAVCEERVASCNAGHR